MSKILFQKKLSFKPQPPTRNAVSLHILKICEKMVRLESETSQHFSNPAQSQQLGEQLLFKYL